MGSIEDELGLNDAKSESSYFDYVEEKATSTEGERSKVLGGDRLDARRAKLAERIKFWKEAGND